MKGMKRRFWLCACLTAALVLCSCGERPQAAVWSETGRSEESSAEDGQGAETEPDSGGDVQDGQSAETQGSRGVEAEPGGESGAQDGQSAEAEPGGESGAQDGQSAEARDREESDAQGSRGAEAASGAAEEDTAARPKVRGIYVTGPMAGTANMDNLIDLVERTELNALVIDIKNDEGYVVCDMEVPLVQEIGSVKRYVRDMPALVQKCKEKGIYLIARIVAFKDPFLAEAKPEWSLHNADGTIFRDKSGLAWVNPYEKQVWNYLIEIAEGAVALGFDEVQFDYIRFSTDSGMSQVDFGAEAQEKSREEVITEFAAYAAQRIHEKNAAVSADVYGVVIDSEVDQQIVGQNYVELARYLDYVSPMVYPSHYGADHYGIPVPDAQPYDTVLAAMQASKKVLAGVEEVSEAAAGQESAPGDAAEGGTAPEGEAGNSATSGDEVSGSAALDGGAGIGTVSGNNAPDDKAEGGEVSGGEGGAGIGSVSGNAVPGDEAEGGETPDAAAPDTAAELSAEEIAALTPMDGVRADVRPWLQDFTAGWVKGHIEYGPEQIREQIQAVYDAGYEEWILWNAANRYTEGGLNGPEEQQEGV